MEETNIKSEKTSKIVKLLAAFGGGVVITLLIVFAVGGNSGLFKGQFYALEEIGSSSSSSNGCDECAKLEHIINLLNNYTAAFNSYTNGINHYTKGMGKYTEGMNKYTEGMKKFTESLEFLPKIVDELSVQLDNGLRILE